MKTLEQIMPRAVRENWDASRIRKAAQARLDIVLRGVDGAATWSVAIYGDTSATQSFAYSSSHCDSAYFKQTWLEKQDSLQTLAKDGKLG